MSANTKIETADKTWNPLKGCSKVSEGCRNCYAVAIAYRFSGKGLPYEGLATRNAQGPQWTGDITLDFDTLKAPLRWKNPSRIFVNSMSDLFHEQVPDEFIRSVFGIMALCPRHTFQIYTKRPERMLEWFKQNPSCGNVFEWVLKDGQRVQLPQSVPWPLPNVHLGVSVENQKAADKRIPLLLDTPAAVRFLSCEPLLGPVDLSAWLVAEGELQKAEWMLSRYGASQPLNWVIVGGESGPDARPMHPEWARTLRDQCLESSIPFFFKQWGNWQPIAPVLGDPDGDLWGLTKLIEHRTFDLVAFETSGEKPKGKCKGEFWSHHPPSKSAWWMAKVGKNAAGRLLEGQEWNQFPTEVPCA